MKTNNNRNHRNRDRSPTATASVANTGIDVLVYRGVDAASGRAVFHWKLGRRNREGDGYYQTFRLEGAGGVWDVLFAIQFLCAKFALVEECGMREELGELAQRLARLIAEMAVGKPVYGADDSNRQPPNGLATAFGAPA